MKLNFVVVLFKFYLFLLVNMEVFKSVILRISMFEKKKIKYIIKEAEWLGNCTLDICYFNERE